jgi:hypothetical protein
MLAIWLQCDQAAPRTPRHLQTPHTATHSPPRTRQRNFHIVWLDHTTLYGLTIQPCPRLTSPPVTDSLLARSGKGRRWASPPEPWRERPPPSSRMAMMGLSTSCAPAVHQNYISCSSIIHHVFCAKTSHEGRPHVERWAPASNHSSGQATRRDDSTRSCQFLLLPRQTVQ